MKSVEIRTTYGSKIIISECLHINVFLEDVKIVYIQYYQIKEMTLKLKDIATINIVNRG